MADVRVATRAQSGLAAPEVTVEVHLVGGIPRFHMVGLPETAVRESADRVRAALAQAGFEFPRRRITVNLSPADLPKGGGRFDLPIAMGLLAASGQVPPESLEGFEFYGELGLNGDLRSVSGILPTVLAARVSGRTLVVPEANGPEAALAADQDGPVRVRAAAHLARVVEGVMGGGTLVEPSPPPAPGAGGYPDLADVRGQHLARRALTVAAAGGHSLLFLGPPGTGKTMLASRLPGILPPMTHAEALEAAAVRSLVAPGSVAETWGRRPIRSPHHSASAVALVGGGSTPRPGEVSLAHQGVLFLDELPEYGRHVLEVLREPLESGRITISRAARQAEFPARFQLVAAMNPCPCGYAGDPTGRCRCTPDQVARYRGKVSGPLLDRIDLHVEVPRLGAGELAGTGAGPASASVREQVVAARERALDRQDSPNANLAAGTIEDTARVTAAARRMLIDAAERLALSHRAYHRIIRVARSVADLAESDDVGERHLAEAIQLRVLDRIP